MQFSPWYHLGNLILLSVAVFSLLVLNHMGFGLRDFVFRLGFLLVRVLLTWDTLIEADTVNNRFLHGETSSRWRSFLFFLKSNMWQWNFSRWQMTRLCIKYWSHFCKQTQMPPQPQQRRNPALAFGNSGGEKKILSGTFSTFKCPPAFVGDEFIAHYGTCIICSDWFVTF